MVLHLMIFLSEFKTRKSYYAKSMHICLQPKTSLHHHKIKKIDHTQLGNTHLAKLKLQWPKAHLNLTAN